MGRGNEKNNYSYDEIGNLVKDSVELIREIQWTVSGKIKKIIRTENSGKPDLEFVYDPAGNRIEKIVKPDGSSEENGPGNDLTQWITTYYVRDASGNIMATYEKKADTQQAIYLKLKELPIYGSSRLGVINDDLDMAGSNSTAPYFSRILGLKQYEGTNHLGNVTSVFTDMKIPRSSNGTTISSYMADVVSATDYYPFGMQMDERSVSIADYRFGFNGKENDNEVKTDVNGNPIKGSQQDYGFRIYDPRIAKFLSVDPLTKSYPWYTPYQFGGNNPIKFIDLDGKEEYDPSQDPYFIAKLITTSFYDVKHSLTNLLLNAYVPTNPGMNWKASYAYDSDGNQIFETVITQVPEQGVIKESIQKALDVANVLGARTFSPNDFLASKTQPNQVTRALRESMNIGDEISIQKQARHLPNNKEKNLNVVKDLDEAKSILSDFKAGNGEVVNYKDFGPSGGGITQVDVKFDNHTGIFKTKDVTTGEIIEIKTNVFRIEGSGKGVKIFPINPEKAKSR